MYSHPRVSLLGLSAAEQQAVEALLTFPSPKSPSYALVQEPAEAQFWVVDADDALAMETLQRCGDLERTVVVGSPRGLAKTSPHVAAQLLRPCEPANVARALDAAVAVQRQRLSATVRAVQTPKARVPARLRRAASMTGATDFHQSTGYSNAVLGLGEPRLQDILLVDADDQTRHPLESRLRRLGYEVEAVARVDTALRRVGDRRFGFVLINMGADSAEAWSLCRHLRKVAWPQGARPKVVVLVSRLRSVDRIRGLLAGCDDMLIKPLNQDDLVRVFSAHDDAFERSFEDTLPPPMAWASGG